jgi:anti-sigma regulatory factor (Ser/Thr protein kinase)
VDSRGALIVEVGTRVDLEDGRRAPPVRRGRGDLRRDAREPAGELPGARGRGLRIIEGLMDTVDVSRGERGTTVTMRRRLGARGDAVTSAGDR